MSYRKKPIVVEAFQVTKKRWAALQPLAKPERGWPTWLMEAIMKTTFTPGCVWYEPHRDLLSIGTLEGALRVSVDDWIICGVKGELYPCKPDIFEATYEPVLEPAEVTT